MANVREAIEREAKKLVDEHVPRLWRSRALIYVPLVVDRITAAVELFQKGDADAQS